MDGVHSRATANARAGKRRDGSYNTHKTTDTGLSGWFRGARHARLNVAAATHSARGSIPFLPPRIVSLFIFFFKLLFLKN